MQKLCSKGVGWDTENIHEELVLSESEKNENLCIILQGETHIRFNFRNRKFRGYNIL